MKISYEWITSFLPGLAHSPHEIANHLTMHSFETTVGASRVIDPHIVVAKIVAIDPHPNADRLRMVTIDAGENHVTVVCGAHNIALGDYVPYSPAGSRVINDKGEYMTVRDTVIRGQASPGMINSPRELGLSPSHSGILILPQLPLGTHLREHLPPDTLLEADISPNRGHDCLSHYGIARELSALLELPLKKEDDQIAADPPLNNWQLMIEEDRLTPRFIGSLVHIKNPAPSPLWVQSRLFTAGVRPINNVVDITNYVMLELGNPIHAYDAKKLPGKTMGVRRAKLGERITTLDGEVRELSDKVLVITCDNAPVAIAGIMGGHDTQVEATTLHIFLEVANFSPYVIQESSAYVGLRTEGSSRWTRGVDPERAQAAHTRSLQLLRDLAGAKSAGTIEHYPRPVKPHVISFAPSRVSRAVGTVVPAEKVRDIFTRLNLKVEEKQPDAWQVTVPADRLDLIGQHDLVEEAVRVMGVNTLPAHMPSLPIATQLPELLRWREAIRDVLVSAGLNEVYSYIFEDQSLTAVLRFDQIKHAELVNPVAPHLRHLRVSLVPGLLAHVLQNKNEGAALRLFEIGNIFFPNKDGTIREQQQLACVIGGRQENGFRLAKGIIDEIAKRCGLSDIIFAQSLASPQNSFLRMWRDGAVADIRQGSNEVGLVGIVSDTITRQLKLPPLTVAEINLDALIAEATSERGYRALPKYPPVFRDIAVLVDPVRTVETVQQVIERTGGELLEDVDLFDIYELSEGEGTVGGPRKGLAFHLKFQSMDKTLTDSEVEAIHKKIELALQEEIGATVR